MSKTYSRFELLDWVVRNRNGLSTTAHYLAMTLAQQYVDWNGRNRFKYWGEVRTLHSQLVDQTGLNAKTIARASAELKKSGMWDYTPGRKGHMSVYVPLMKVSKTASLVPLADEHHADNLPVEIAPVQDGVLNSSRPSAPDQQHDPFGYRESGKTPQRESRTLAYDFQRSAEAQGKMLEWKEVHTAQASIFPRAWHDNAKNANNHTILGMNHIVKADQDKLLKSIAVLRSKGWRQTQLKNFLQNHPTTPAQIQKDFVAFILYLFKVHAASSNPADYTSGGQVA